MALHEAGKSGSVLLAAMALSAFAAGGCATDEKLEKSDLVEQANAICKPHTEKIRAASGELLAGGRLPSKKEVGQLARSTVEPEVRAQITGLRGLKPADDLADDYRKWLDDSDMVLGEMVEDPSIIMSADNFETVNREAADLGMSRDCYIGPG